MVDSGQPHIRSVDFQSPVNPGLPVEVLQRVDLMVRVGTGFFDRPDRPMFDGLMLIKEGPGTHTVDFETIPLRPGRLIRTRPGQVQAWDTKNRIDATIVIATMDPGPGPGWFPGHGAYCDLGIESLQTARAIITALENEQDRFRPDQPSVRLMTNLYAAFGALFDRAKEPMAKPDDSDPYTAYRTVIEAGLGRSHNVRDYAATLGYSERTISRACQRVTGLTAKGVLNQRLVLEAKRLLAHTDKPAASISASLGFSEPTNFHKFFARHTNQRPSEFRAANRTTPSR